MKEDLINDMSENISSAEDHSINMMDQLAEHLREEARGMITPLPRWMQ